MSAQSKFAGAAPVAHMGPLPWPPDVGYISLREAGEFFLVSSSSLSLTHQSLPKETSFFEETQAEVPVILAAGTIHMNVLHVFNCMRQHMGVALGGPTLPWELAVSGNTASASSRAWILWQGSSQRTIWLFEM